jgi:hypothetical protein
MLVVMLMLTGERTSVSTSEYFRVRNRKSGVIIDAYRQDTK